MPIESKATAGRRPATSRRLVARVSFAVARRMPGRPGRLALLLALLMPTALAAPAAVAAAEPTFHVPVLMYHHVMPPSQIPSTERWPGLYVDPPIFAAQMKALKANGWHTITARALAEALTAGRRLPDRTLVISFDDGGRDTYRYAVPILRKYGFVATFYVTRTVRHSHTHLTAKQLRILAATGNEVANHTWAHRALARLPFDRARRQIRRANDLIETIVGRRPVTLAYPYGRHNRNAIRAAAAEGIRMAFTTEAGVRESKAAPLDVPRVRIAGMHANRRGSFSGGTGARDLLRRLAPYGPPRVTRPVVRLYNPAAAGAVTVPVQVRWSARDPLGVRTLLLRRQRVGGRWSTVDLRSAATHSIYRQLAIGATYRFAANATNDAGARSTAATGPAFTPRRVEQDNALVVSEGAWTSVAAGSVSAGRTRHAVEHGASVSFTFTGSSVGWVAARGTDRGSAKVYVDATYRATIDLHAMKPSAAQVVYAVNWTNAGTHTIRIECLGTNGHPRVDVEAFLWLAPESHAGGMAADGPHAPGATRWRLARAQ